MIARQKILLMIAFSIFSKLRPSTGLAVNPVGKLRRAFSSRLADTESSRHAAKLVGVRPPWNAPKFVWRFAWNLQKAALPLLHRFDSCRPSDRNVNLSVLWWKAIAENCRGGRSACTGFAFDLLPPVTRTLVARPLCYLFPRLHHQNVAIRTAFLDKAVRDEISRHKALGETAPLVVVLGAGFDTRAVRFLAAEKSSKEEEGEIPGGRAEGSAATAAAAAAERTRWVELDLPSVVEQKASLFEARLRGRRGSDLALPFVAAVDLNDDAWVRTQLEAVLFGGREAAPLSSPSSSSDSSALMTAAATPAVRAAPSARGRPVIFVVEAVMLYLDKPFRPNDLLKTCLEVAVNAPLPPRSSQKEIDEPRGANNSLATTTRRSTQGASSVSFCFADRLPQVSDRDVGLVAANDRLPWAKALVVQPLGISPAPPCTPEIPLSAVTAGGGGGGGGETQTETAAPTREVENSAEKERALGFWRAVSPSMRLIEWQTKPGLASHMGTAAFTAS